MNLLEATRLQGLGLLAPALAEGDSIRSRCEWRVDKFFGIDFADPRMKRLWERGELRPDEVCGGAGNLLMTVGATDLWNGLVTAGLGTPWNSANAMLVVGDGVSAAAAGDTDMGAAAGTKINAADPSSATNATPIVVSGTFSPSAVVGAVYVLSGFSGAGASAINNTFECSVGGASSMTLLNSAGTGAITVTGGLIKPINKYRQLVNGAPAVSTNTVQFVAVFAAANANFHWQEFGVTLGGATTNKQAAPPSKLFDHAIADNGTKVSTGTFTMTITLTAS